MRTSVWPSLLLPVISSDREVARLPAGMPQGLQGPLLALDLNLAAFLYVELTRAHALVSVTRRGCREERLLLLGPPKQDCANT